MFADRITPQELTSYVSLGRDETEWRKGVQKVALIFSALRECIGELTEFYRGLAVEDAPQQKSSKGSQSFKASTQLRSRVTNPSPAVFPFYTEYHVREGQKQRFKYEGRLTPPDSARAVFKARTVASDGSEGREIVVKFAESYSEEAHRMLAAETLAPELLHCERISDEVHFVVMDYFDGRPMEESDLEGEDKDTLIKSLRKALDILHKRGFVFGDLREPNILISGGDLRLVDFDWCGKVGEAFYPQNISMEIVWPSGVGPSAEITIAHDEAQYKTLIKPH